MRVITCVLLLVVCAMSARAETPYWVEPMRQVHDSYTGSGGTIARFGDSITVSLAFFKPMMGTQTNTSAQDNPKQGFFVRDATEDQRREESDHDTRVGNNIRDDLMINVNERDHQKGRDQCVQKNAFPREAITYKDGNCKQTRYKFN